MSTSSKTRMVSFRLTPDEYDSFRELCFTHGLRSFSELARVGVNLLLEKSADTPQRALEARVGIIEARMRMLAMKIDRLDKSMEDGNGLAFKQDGSS